MTRGAISSYQVNRGLAANGYITDEFVSVLNQDIDAYNRLLPTATPTPVAPAPASQRTISGGTYSNPASYASAYVLNWNTMKFHYPSCSSVSTIAIGNREDVYLTRNEIFGMGFSPCGRCHP
jgi:hypothetical protein